MNFENLHPSKLAAFVDGFLTGALLCWFAHLYKKNRD